VLICIDTATKASAKLQVQHTVQHNYITILYMPPVVANARTWYALLTDCADRNAVFRSGSAFLAVAEHTTRALLNHALALAELLAAIALSGNVCYSSVH
jgi:hypothetical protein